MHHDFPRFRPKNWSEKPMMRGMEFFISKPINIIEVKSVIQKVEKQIENEKTLSNIKKMFMAEIADMPKEKKPDDGYGRKVQYILNRLRMSGEKGGDDIMRICQYLHSNKRPISQVSIGQLLRDFKRRP